MPVEGRNTGLRATIRRGTRRRNTSVKAGSGRLDVISADVTEVIKENLGVAQIAQAVIGCGRSAGGEARRDCVG
ncbi:Hypothetical protein NTJ_08552 [Nesidiocoris tenuis]|uniref:Uncharacterized protein n=1 Tax=Nesidiocoris tenuis TaxID=355587 RepID=A0ABN7AU58_9HEMI|nr:Hypothetical protein NTJ_08552 [Nesidiocoris tenuis]